MSDLDEKLARWRQQTEAVKPPAELLAKLTALAIAQSAAAAGGAATTAGAAATGKALATKGAAAKVWLLITAVGAIGAGAVVASRMRVPPELASAEDQTAPVAASAPTPETAAGALPTAVAAPDVARVGFLTVRANKPAVVFVDGAKLGSAPIVHRPLKAGPHRLRIDCLRDGGSYTAGEQRITLPPDAELDVTNTCIERYLFPDGGAAPEP